VGKQRQMPVKARPARAVLWLGMAEVMRWDLRVKGLPFIGGPYAAAEGYPVEEAHIQYLSPCRYKPLSRRGYYAFTNPTQLAPLQRCPQRHPNEPCNSARLEEKPR
ncbi:hypothetical protein, partial [Hymenobacter sp. AT01-02]|uniref:hypothetical protein n=1 Tax=Hymenobacter sp. AT01-02 TaxID=1571877 RepID=UPI00137938F7